MEKVIVYQNQKGNVSVCYPTGELPIEEVLTKDCPEGAVIVDAAALPQNDNDFFDAWRLVNGAIVVDLAAAKDIALWRFNNFAKDKADERAKNTAIGIENDVSDADFLKSLTAKRLEINTATSTAELRNL